LEYFRPALTCDVIVFTIRDGRLQVLLVRRGRPPFRGRWAIPGGFVEKDEPLERAARRELEEETALRDVYLEQLYTFGDPGRDPRGHTVTVAYLALVNPARFGEEGGRPSSDLPSGKRGTRNQERGTGNQKPETRNLLRAGDDAAELGWFPVYRLPALAFDHNQVLAVAVERLRNKLFYTTVGFEFLGRAFTLSELQRVYEILLNRKQDKRNFRRRILSLGILKPLGGTRREGRHRPARLYAFRKPGWTYLRERALVT
jgi:8-oxo-dGTP diphosphatase